MTGEHFAGDVQELIRLLHRHRVRYLLIGGEAVIHHGYPRLTGDVDFAYDNEPGNCERLFAALTEFWEGPVPAVESSADLLEPGIVIQFGRPPNRIDLLNRLGAIPFAKAWQRRVKETLNTRTGKVPVPIIGLEDLLQVKREVGRHKDLDDVEHLARLRKKPPAPKKTRRSES